MKDFAQIQLFFKMLSYKNFFVGSAEASSSVTFLFTDWLKLNNLKSRIEHSSLDISVPYF